MSAVLLLLVGLPAATAAGGPCTPEFDPTITAPAEAITNYSNAKAPTQQINDYFALVDAESDRVATGQFATSWLGQPLVYALVTSEANAPHVEQIAAAQQMLRDPRITTPAEAAQIAATSPAIAWYSGNVHGDEPSGADAAVEILYELAARTDCGAQPLLDDLVVGIIPIQNPDGRNGNDRENDYGFDMNRDWFAGTQPETAGKLELLNAYPPVLYIDAHEMGGNSFFFPPNADPVYHEMSPESIGWIYDLYGPALGDEFNDRGWNHFNYSIYDLFYMGYGDTVPTAAFTSAGMTFEKGSSDTYHQRWLEQWVAGWTSLATTAATKEAILTEYYAAHVDALSEGAQGRLEPNEVYEPGNDVEFEVPDLTVRHYFLPPAPAGAFPDAARLVDRLLDMGVEVRQLTRKLSVPDLQAFGRDPGPGFVPKGSYWIPMEQPQKRWVQALLGEDTYVPFAYFYDVTAWSNPLLFNLGATFSGAVLSPRATPVTVAPRGRLGGNVGTATHFWFHGDSGRAVAAGMALDRDGLAVRRVSSPAGSIPAGAFVLPAGPGVADAVRSAAAEFVLKATASTGPVPNGPAFVQPKIAVYDPTGFDEESLRHLRYTLDQVWQMPWTPLSGSQMAGGALQAGGYDVLVVPGISTGGLTTARPQIESWIDAGGTYVGTARPGGTGGTPFAVSSGWTSSQLSTPPGLSIPGSLFRVALTSGSPTTLGAGPFAYWFNLEERVLSPSSTGTNAGVYPTVSPDFWWSGYAQGTNALKGSAALVEESLGAGNVVLFSGEPNYRAYTEGSAFLLANAIAYPAGARADGIDVASPEAAPAVRAAMASARPATGPGRAVQVVVPTAQAAVTAGIVARFTAAATADVVGSSVYLRIPNPAGFDVQDHPYALLLLEALRAAGVEVRSLIV